MALLGRMLQDVRIQHGAESIAPGRVNALEQCMGSSVLPLADLPTERQLREVELLLSTDVTLYTHLVRQFDKQLYRRMGSTGQR